MKNQPARRFLRDYGAVDYDPYDAARRLDAEQGSRELLERQIRFHQYPCRLAPAPPADAIIKALGE